MTAMDWKSVVRDRLRARTGDPALDGDVIEELADHLEQRYDDKRLSGTVEDAARAEVLSELDGPEGLESALLRARRRARPAPAPPPPTSPRMFGDVWRDVRYGGRLLAGAPGFTAAAVLMLALGIGATTAIFSALDAVLLRPLPYPQPDRLVQVFETLEDGTLNNVSGGAFRDWRERESGFDSLALFAPVTLNLHGSGTPERLGGLEVSHEFLQVLGIEPLLGRAFGPGNDRPGGDNAVVVLTEELWRSRFGGAASILGKTIVLDEVPRTVIGVLPAGAWLFRETQFFVPAVLDPATPRSTRMFHWAEVYGRLKPGITVARADARLKTIKQQLASDYPDYKKRWNVAVRPLQELLAGDPRPVLTLLLGAVALVLLIACANVANLLLARAYNRQQEIALRAALGADSLRIVRQVLAESLLLAGLGGATGIVLSYWGVDLLRYLTADLLPRAMAPRLDGRVLLFAAAVTTITGLLFGILPALRIRRPDFNQTLKSGGRRGTVGGRNRTQSTLVVVEVALTVVLLASTGLLLRSLARTATVDPGFEPDHVVAFDLSLPGASYQTAEQRLAFSRAFLERIRALPGVEAAGTGMAIPFTTGGFGEYLRRADRPDRRDEVLGRIDFVSEGYLEALGTRLLAGRTFTVSDNRQDGQRVAVVNQALVQAFFPDGNAIGRGITTGGNSLEIVGVIANVVDRRLDLTHRPYVYVPQAFNPFAFSVAVRTPLDPIEIAGSIRGELQRLDPGLPLANVRALDVAMADSMSERRLILGLIGAFATAALVLACLGLYAVMAYSVVTRRRELCIRMALGAARRDVMRHILGDGLRLMAVGLVLGLAGALVAGRLLTTQLYQVRSADPLVATGAAAAIATVALAACWIPAWNATRFSPIAALRDD